MANRYYPPIIWHSLIVQWFVCRQLPTITSLWFWELESSQLLEAPGPRIADVYHLKLQWNSLSNGVLAVTVQSRFGVFALPLSFRWQRTCEVLSCEQWRRSHWKPPEVWCFGLNLSLQSRWRRSWKLQPHGSLEHRTCSWQRYMCAAFLFRMCFLAWVSLHVPNESISLSNYARVCRSVRSVLLIWM